jgi:alpha-mannosidase
MKRTYIIFSLLALSFSIVNAQQKVDYSRTRTLHAVASSHLDTQWQWTIQNTINDYVPKTILGNFALFEKFPDYKFSFEGAIKYMFVKEYYPNDFIKLKKYISDGRWNIAGSSLDAGDVNIPSPEAITRSILYGQNFYQQEFGKKSRDIFLPDCFGFGLALPTIASSCGLRGFSTTKLEWGCTVELPFDIGAWQGVDGSKILAVLTPGGYLTHITEDLSHKQKLINKADTCGKESNTFVTYMYFGTGDTGGAPDDESVSWLEKSLQGTGPLKVISAPSDLLCREIDNGHLNKMLSYKGELILSTHGTGCYTSQSGMKRLNRQNELLADAAERASIAADWLGGIHYPKAKLSDAWIRFLWHQFHDDLTGTSIQEAYTFSWNDELVSRKQFSCILQDGAGAISAGLDTRVEGIALVVYNPLSVEREDIVSASVKFDKVPAFINVFDTVGREIPSQIVGRGNKSLDIIFLAKVPSVSFSVFDIRASNTPSKIKSGLLITKKSLENSRYLVKIDSKGDVSSIFDKAQKKEMLKSPIRLELYNDMSIEWPAWEILYKSISSAPNGFVDSLPRVEIIENGPVRISLKITREKYGSQFEQVITLAYGNAGNKLNFITKINWRSQGKLLKAIFPLNVDNENATYDLGMGTIERRTNTSRQYEVPAQQWADLTDNDGNYGISIMNDCKYGWDKPDNSTLRLTLIHTPLSRSKWGFKDQEYIDIGQNTFAYSISGHKGDWRSGQTQWEAARLNQPLLAFQSTKHAGILGRSFSLLKVSSDQIMVKAIKKAENSDEIVLRLQELFGKPVEGAYVKFADPVLSAREINGAEEPIGNTIIDKGMLKFNIGGYSPKSFAIKLGHSKTLLTMPHSTFVPIKFDLDGVSWDNNKADGDFNNNGISYPAELFPDTIISEGIRFIMGPKQDGRNNVLVCKGNKIELPENRSNNKLYILAASAKGDTKATFLIDGKPYPINIPDFQDNIGQWNVLLMNGKYLQIDTLDRSESAIKSDTDPYKNEDKARYEMKPAYLKNENIAWYGTHKHDGNNNLNVSYKFCYIFKLGFDLPANAHMLTLPDDDNVRIFAISVADNPNDKALLVTSETEEFKNVPVSRIQLYK